MKFLYKGQYNKVHEASLVQLVERWFPKPSVEGSSPSGRVKKIYC